jgi:hypothetical protein
MAEEAQDQGIGGKYLNLVLSALGMGGAKGAMPLLKGIISPAVASRIPMVRKSLPRAGEIPDVIERSGGQITPEGDLMLNILRYQKPSQAGALARSGGVFYAPESRSTEARQVYGTRGNFWGGSQAMQGPSIFRNPYIVQGPSGMMADDRIAGPLLGQKYEDMLVDAMRATDPERVGHFFQQYAPNVKPIPTWLQNQAPERMFPWLTEAAVGSKARELGYDAIMPYSTRISGRYPGQGIGEVFDLRQMRYPKPDDLSGESTLWPQYQPKTD